jgi:general secretion pathway protein D
MKINKLVPFLVLAISIIVAAEKAGADQPAKIKLRDVDIRVFIETVAKITEKNFILDPSVNGRVNVMVHKSIEKDQLYDLFLAVLDVHGYTASTIGHSVKIVPKTQIKPIDRVQVSQALAKGNSRQTRVLYAKHLPVTKLLIALQPLMSNDVNMISVDAGNAIIVTDTAHNIQRLEKIMSQLDRAEQQHTVLVKLEHTKAQQLAPTLNEYNLAQGEVVKTTIVADTASNSLMLSGSKARISQLQLLIQQFDQRPLDTSLPKETQVIYLQFTQAAELAPLISQMVANGGENSSSVQVEAEPNINAILIKADAVDMKVAIALINKLDVRRAQVLVEAIIAEVSTTKAAELGFQWAMGKSGAIGVSSFGGSGPNIVELRSDPQSLGSGLSFGIGQFVNSGLGFGALLRALAKDAHTNIISTPSILTLDNQEAKIVVGQSVPFVTGKYSNSESGGGAGKPFQTIKRQDVGLSLTIKPQIGTGGAIKLSIEQEISSINPQSNSAADIITNKRSIKTQVMASHDDLIILGGLIDDTLQETTEKVPMLGDLPILGQLFKYSKTQQVKRNLMIFIKPTIILDEAISSQLALEKYQTIRTLQMQGKTKIPLLPGEVRPALSNLGSLEPKAIDMPEGSSANSDMVDW